MRQRRIDAKTRVIAREFLAGVRGAVDTCERLSCRAAFEKRITTDDRKFLDHVASRGSDLPVGDRLQLWHENAVAGRLARLVTLEAEVKTETEAICHRILNVLAKCKVEKDRT